MNRLKEIIDYRYVRFNSVYLQKMFDTTNYTLSEIVQNFCDHNRLRIHFHVITIFILLL